MGPWPQGTKCQHWTPSCRQQVAGTHLSLAPPSSPHRYPRPPAPAHRLCLLGDPLGDPLAGEPLGDPFPWEPLLSPLNMVVKQVPAQAGHSWEEGGKATRVLAGHQAGSGEVGRRSGKAVSARPLPAGAVSPPGPARACPGARPGAPTAPAQPVWEERVQPRGGAPARLPRRFGLVTPTRPAREQLSHPGQVGKWPGGCKARQTDRSTHAGACSARVCQTLGPLRRGPLSTGPPPIARPARRGGATRGLALSSTGQLGDIHTKQLTFFFF